MTDKVKTPEELADIYCEKVVKTQGLASFDVANEVTEAFLAGYSAAKQEFLDENYAVFFFDGIKYKAWKWDIVRRLQDIQRIQEPPKGDL